VTVKPTGKFRDEVWGTLMRERAATYPLPPHGHHPNFTGARAAAERLLAHPDVARLRVLVIGPERALYAARKLALAHGKTLFVPDQRREGWYYRLHGNEKAAELKRMPELGEPKLHPEAAEGAVLACVAVDRKGARVSKGFGWAARGLNLGIPEFTLAHPLMLRDELPCEADSRVALVGTPDAVVTCASD